MVKTRVSLESDFRLERIKNIKQYAFVAQWFVFLLLALFIVYTEGMETAPFFFPIDGAVFFLCIVMAIMVGEGIAFRLLEMKNEESYSSKYLMARKASQRSIIYLILAIVVIVILITPPIVGAIEGISSQQGTLLSGEHKSFPSESVTGTMLVSSVTVSVASGEADVFIVTADDFEKYGTSVSDLRVNTLGGFYRITPGVALVVEFGENAEREEYVIVVHSATGEVSYDLEYSMSGTFRFVVPLLTVIIAIVNLGWYIALIPMKKKFKNLSIYA